MAAPGSQAVVRDPCGGGPAAAAPRSAEQRSSPCRVASAQGQEWQEIKQILIFPALSITLSVMTLEQIS